MTGIFYHIFADLSIKLENLRKILLVRKNVIASLSLIKSAAVEKNDAVDLSFSVCGYTPFLYDGRGIYEKNIQKTFFSF